MNKKIILIILSIAGVLFSGYLSGIKFFTSSCALGETCPQFLGYPACYFGFGMYVLLLIFSLLYAKWPLRIVSALGILFAGYFTIQELPVLFSDGFSAFAMGLPTCAWGLIMFTAIFILSLKLDK